MTDMDPLAEPHTYHGPVPLDEADPELVDALRALEPRWGSLGVALTAAQLSDVPTVVRCLEGPGRAPRCGATTASVFDDSIVGPCIHPAGHGGMHKEADRWYQHPESGRPAHVPGAQWTERNDPLAVAHARIRELEDAIATIPDDGPDLVANFRDFIQDPPANATHAAMPLAMAQQIAAALPAAQDAEDEAFHAAMRERRRGSKEEP